MLQTYLNDPKLKHAFLTEITKHEEQDALIKGSYGTMNGMFKGCAIGCSLHSLNVLQGKVGKDQTWQTGNHERYEAELGLPTWFAYMEDHLFENLPNELATTWPRRLAEAIPVGAVVDDIVLAKILRWSLADAEFGVRHATDDSEIRGHIDAVAAYFDLEIIGGATTEQREAAAARAARAARDAWDAWAAWDAWTARDAWTAWTARTARTARDEQHTADSGASAASRKKAPLYYPALSEYVLQLMRELTPTAVTHHNTIHSGAVMAHEGAVEDPEPPTDERAPDPSPSQPQGDGDGRDLSEE